MCQSLRILFLRRSQRGSSQPRIATGIRQRRFMMPWQKLVCGVLIAGFGSGVALAQSTLGELLDAGGVKLSKQQVLEAVTGATVSGPTLNGGTMDIGYKADGTYSGSYQGRAGARGIAKEGGVFGKWTVEEDGKLCTEGHGGAGKDTARCVVFFRVGDQLYEVLGSGANRSAAVLKRAVKR
jgi:hypothetical protein